MGAIRVRASNNRLLKSRHSYKIKMAPTTSQRQLQLQRTCKLLKAINSHPPILTPVTTPYHKRPQTETIPTEHLAPVMFSNISRRHVATTISMTRWLLTLHRHSRSLRLSISARANSKIWAKGPRR